MDIALIVKGFLVGFSVAAPIGPIAILCIRQTLGYGFWGGIMTGLGATVADAIYTAATCSASKIILPWIELYNKWFNLMGGAFLVYIAYTISKTKERELSLKAEARNLFSAFFSTFLLTFLSPMTTFLFLSMFMSYEVFNFDLTYEGVAYITLGVALGSFAWWVILSSGIAHFYRTGHALSFQRFFQKPLGSLLRPLMGFIWPTLKTHTTVSVFQAVNKLSALAISIYGLLTLSRFFTF